MLRKLPDTWQANFKYQLLLNLLILSPSFSEITNQACFGIPHSFALVNTEDNFPILTVRNFFTY